MNAAGVCGGLEGNREGLEERGKEQSSTKKGISQHKWCQNSYISMCTTIISLTIPRVELRDAVQIEDGCEGGVRWERKRGRVRLRIYCATGPRERLATASKYNSHPAPSVLSSCVHGHAPA